MRLVEGSCPPPPRYKDSDRSIWLRSATLRRAVQIARAERNREAGDCPSLCGKVQGRLQLHIRVRGPLLTTDSSKSSAFLSLVMTCPCRPRTGCPKAPKSSCNAGDANHKGKGTQRPSQKKNLAINWPICRWAGISSHDSAALSRNTE